MSLYKFVDASRKDILENFLIRFTQPLLWNDPFEMHPHYYDDIPPKFVGEIFKSDYISIYEIDRLINENFVSLSLTENPYNLLMWAHYSKNHEGFLIEFDESSEFFLDKRKLLFKIPYSNLRPILSKKSVVELIYKLRESLKAGLVINEEDLLNLRAVFSKSIDWKDEQEWRLVTLTDFAEDIKKINKKKEVYYSFGTGSPAVRKLCSDYIALFKLPPECIKSIVFGYNVNQKIRRDIFLLKEANKSLVHLKLFQAFMDVKE